MYIRRDETPKKAKMFAIKITPEFDTAPEAQLILAIFIQAAYDITKVENVKKSTPEHKRVLWERDKEHACSFFSENSFLTTYFESYCESVNIEPTWIRMIARKIGLI